MRTIAALVAVILLLTVYMFQRYNFFILFFSDELHRHAAFVFNKTLRMIANDVACIILIWALFQEAKYLKMAFYVFLFEVLILLPLYFVLKLWLEGDSEISSPLLSQVHRLIVNPTLMILLMVAFFYQKMKVEKNGL